MTSKLPWFKFYPTDWLGSGSLRRADLAVKGFYIDLLCVMFDCEFPGMLETNGNAWTDEEISKSVNGDPCENMRHLRRLLDMGILSRNSNKTVFSRRMVRDENKRRSCSRAGKKGGGNPHLAETYPDSTTFKGQSKGESKGAPKLNKPPETRDQKPETRSQIPETREESESPSAQESASDSTPSPDEVFDEVIESWNQVPGVVKAERITAKRRASLNARMREAYFRSNWREGIARAASSEFLQGSKGWRADLEWFLRPDSLVKLMEGMYDNARAGPTQPSKGGGKPSWLTTEGDDEA